ncbi:hypothetical protein MBLNU230_g5893t1 [Neophaeotheca triangularis]
MVQLTCAQCQEEGKLACKSCLLVLKYCGRNCQEKHWTAHKQDCKSPLTKLKWKPQWEVEGRAPLFIGGPPVTILGENKYLWGNIPAYDVLKLDANEGANYAKELRILFAASGDIRNVVKTLASVPSTFKGKMIVTINDLDFDLVARNAVLLLIAFAAESPEKAVDCMIHIWYSASIGQEHSKLLQGVVRECVQDVCTKIETKPAGTLLGKTWEFKMQGSLRLVLPKEQWFKLLKYFECPKDLTLSRAEEARKAITLAHERRDHRDRSLFAQPPGVRVAKARFREDGILLPFGQSRKRFTQPNPTLFFSQRWPLKDSADPLDGWRHQDLQNSSYGAARNDIYGSLFNHLETALLAFLECVNSHAVHFELFNVNAEKLNEQLQDSSYARVEVSNISDLWCLGPGKTAACLGRFLQSPDLNPHATLITLFMNAVAETSTMLDRLTAEKTERVKVLEYMPPISSSGTLFGAQELMNDMARDLVRDNDKYFDRFMERHGFKDIERNMGIVIKDCHTIIGKWPMRLQRQPHQQGAVAEFRGLLASAHTGAERYVEWRKAWNWKQHLPHAIAVMTKAEGNAAETRAKK